MKINNVIFTIISTIIVFLSCKTTPVYSEGLCVTSNKEAILIADSIWRNTFGKKIDNYKPFNAKKINDSVWVVEGSLHAQKGGVPYVEINANTCEIIKVTHGK